LLSNKYKGHIISKDTLRTEDLLKNIIEFLEEDDLLKNLYKDNRDLHHDVIEDVEKAEMLIRLMQLTDELDYMQEYDEYRESAAYLLDEFFETLNIIAPKGTYFGTMEGNGSTFGFFEQREDW